MIDYNGYTGVFEFDAELEIFTGHVVDLRDQIYFEGDSVEGATSLDASSRGSLPPSLRIQG
jgi:predicted HicB family RNase H-like nuclease